MTEEADTAIQEAYGEGYKAGVLEYKPESAGQKAINQELESESAKMQSRLASNVPWWYVPVYSTGSFVLGIVTSEIINKIKD
jgi:hypothetical protein